MEIAALLLEPTLVQIEKELQELADRINRKKSSRVRSQDLLVKVCSLLSDSADLKKEIGIFNPEEGGIVPVSFYQELRRLKRETHSTQRFFLKIESNELRFKKMAARRNDVSTVAA